MRIVVFNINEFYDNKREKLSSIEKEMRIVIFYKYLLLGF